MTKTRFVVAALLLAAGTDAFAQVPALQNTGFETPLSELNENGRKKAKNWRHHNTALRRFNGDVATPDPPLIRSGVASMSVPDGGPDFNFSGFDCDNFNSQTLMLDMPLYAYGCGPATFSLWYAIPADAPYEFKRLGLKWEIKRDNFSVFEIFEDLEFGPESNGGTGHTNGQWEQFVTDVTNADFEYKFNFFNDTAPFDGIGEQWADSSLIVMTNLVAVVYAPLMPGEVENGLSYWDDAFFLQDMDGPGDSIEIWDDTFTKANATLGTGITEAAIPVFLNGTQVGYRCVAGNDNFKQVDFFDAVGATKPFRYYGTFPLAWRDTVANGRVKPYVQFEDSHSGGGSAVITSPSYKATGQPLKLAPTYSRADIAAGISALNRDLTADPVQFGDPIRTNNFKLTGTGNYGPAALTSRRDYGMEPSVGVTTFTLNYTFTTTSAITLDGTATGRGFDAFRFITISSMLANIGMGQYDARFIAVEDPSGNIRTLAIDDAPRNVYLYTAPQPTAVGRSFWLYQDTGGLTNPDSPTIEVELTSLTGAAGALGVNAFLDASTSPTVNSLSAWIEWVGAPATIPSGTVITATFTIRAYEATDLGDANHDGLIDCADAAILVSLCDQTETNANFNAYVDMNGDGTINAADETLLEAITGTCPGMCGSAPVPCPGDADGNGMVNFADITNVLANFGNVYPGGDGPGDGDHNGTVNFADITAVLANFGVPCP